MIFYICELEYKSTKSYFLLFERKGQEIQDIIVRYVKLWK